MAVDPKSKIDEMLRKKRASGGEESARTARTAQPAPAPQQQQQTSFTQSEQHGSVMDRINAMLKNKSVNNAPQVQIENFSPPVHANAEAAAGSVYIPVKELPFGLCSCCELPFPLAATNAGKICCPSSGSQYVRNVDGSVAPMPPEVNLPAADSIEDALNAGNAAFYYGGFIGGAEQEQPTRRRRRR